MRWRNAGIFHCVRGLCICLSHSTSDSPLESKIFCFYLRAEIIQDYNNYCANNFGSVMYHVFRNNIVRSQCIQCETKLHVHKTVMFFVVVA
jgi:hypothetical protein